MFAPRAVSLACSGIQLPPSHASPSPLALPCQCNIQFTFVKLHLHQPSSCLPAASPSQSPHLFVHAGHRRIGHRRRGLVKPRRKTRETPRAFSSIEFEASCRAVSRMQTAFRPATWPSFRGVPVVVMRGALDSLPPLDPTHVAYSTCSVYIDWSIRGMAVHQ